MCYLYNQLFLINTLQFVIFSQNIQQNSDQEEDKDDTDTDDSDSNDDSDQKLASR